MIKRFVERFVKNGGIPIDCKNAAGAVESVKNIIKKEAVSQPDFRLYVSDAVSEKFDKSFKGNLRSRIMSDRLAVEFCEHYSPLISLAVVPAEIMLCEEGAFVIAADESASWETLVPPANIFVAKDPVFYKNMHEYFADVKRHTGSPVTMIAGPSRTADIEKQIVLGMHGPKRIYAIIL